MNNLPIVKQLEVLKLKNDLEDFKNSLDLLEAAKIFVKNGDRAICVKIVLGNESSFDYWIENNNNLIPFIKAEEKTINELIQTTESKINEINGGESFNPEKHSTMIE